MLISFSVENYFSIKDEILFTMEATKYKSDTLSNDFTIGTLNLLRTGVIFGPNGSGKSNILLAMKQMREIVENTHSDNIAANPFKFDIDYIDRPTKFEVKFLMNDIIYRYGFSFKKNLIVEEWLYYKKNKPSTRESQYFQRNYQDFKNFGDYKKEADLIKKEDKTREDKLYLTIVAEFNGKISRNIMNWFDTFNTFSSIHSDLSSFTIGKMRDKTQLERIISFMQSADFGIIDLQEKKIEFDEIPSKISNNVPEDLINDLKKNGATTLETYHNKYQNKKFVGIESLPFSKESDGTQKLFDLTGVILEALDNGEILIIDELDNSFHTRIIEEIIKLFNSDRNINNSQLIFVSHDTNILTQKLFRRDQIWFTEKNIYGETDLYSLIDFGTRKDSVLEKNYLAGKYGSIPIITNLEY